MTALARTAIRICVGLVVASGAPTTDAQDRLVRHAHEESPPPETWRFLGSASCSAGACHNQGNASGAADLAYDKPRTFWEYQYWRHYDPHRDAYAVLLDARSKGIEARLTGVPLTSARPQENGLCLSCHVHQNYDIAYHGPNFQPSEGVSCESCHGAAERWLSAHTGRAWDWLDREQKAEMGFVPLERLSDRVRSCVPCHVGSSALDTKYGLIDANHDLIAAGHPRLIFEFASYHTQYPKHWPDARVRLADPAYEARAWIVGQLATAEASLKLLSARAERSIIDQTSDLPDALSDPIADEPRAGPWPEFAEYDCYACHHDLRGGVPLSVGIAAAAPGQWPWGNWYTPMSRAIESELPPPRGEWSDILRALNEEMTQPAPSVGIIKDRTDEAIVLLDDWLASLHHRPIDSTHVQSLMDSIVDQVRGAGVPTWDRNAQAYLGLAALYAAQADLEPNRRDPELSRALDEMLSQLRFREDTNSPPDYRIEALADPLSTFEERTAN